MLSAAKSPLRRRCRWPNRYSRQVARVCRSNHITPVWQVWHGHQDCYSRGTCRGIDNAQRASLGGRDAKSYKHQGAAAWLEDEGVFDSSDDIDIIPYSDDDDQF
jgi:hypothetical protein